MSKKYVCIHGHFYQPPRENAWVEEIELQDSAAPFHDWNERITHECYRPNGVARVLNKRHKIVDIVNNYAQLSFNFGPTLLSWLKNHEPKAYQSVIEADKQSMVNFNGHGSAMAQVYNHIIMPWLVVEIKKPRLCGESMISANTLTENLKVCGWPKQPWILRRLRY